jgi:hypothetical protein
MSALSYAGEKEFDTRAILEESVGWIWCSRVSLLASNDNSGAFYCAGGSTSMLVLSLMWWSSSCTPNVWDRLLKSLSQFPERAKLLLIVCGPLFAGIRSLR